MKITIDIPDAQAIRVIDAYAVAHGWTADASQTKAQFAKQVLLDNIVGVVASQEGEDAANKARLAAVEKARAEIVIT